MAVFKSRFAGGTGIGGGGVAPRCPQGVDYINIQVNIPTEALDSGDEQILLYKFPDDGDCWLFRGGSNTTTTPIKGADQYFKLSDVDSGTGLVWDAGIGDVDGVIDTALLTGSTVGQAAGTDWIDTADAPLDVSGKYLIFDVTTAASTGVAGTIEVGMKVAFGKKLEVDSGVSA
jgi:hypothetical protein